MDGLMMRDTMQRGCQDDRFCGMKYSGDAFATVVMEYLYTEHYDDMEGIAKRGIGYRTAIERLQDRGQMILGEGWHYTGRELYTWRPNGTAQVRITYRR